MGEMDGCHIVRLAKAFKWWGARKKLNRWNEISQQFQEMSKKKLSTLVCVMAN